MEQPWKTLSSRLYFYYEMYSKQQNHTIIGEEEALKIKAKDGTPRTTTP